jgi:hypothetical protein
LGAGSQDEIFREVSSPGTLLMSSFREVDNFREHNVVPDENFGSWAKGRVQWPDNEHGFSVIVPAKWVD